MFSKIKEFCLLFCLFNQVSRNYGSLKSPTLLEDLLLKEIIHSIDIASDNENLFKIILKLLNSVCACVQQTLNEKQNSIFNVETNILREDEDNTVSNIELYKKIYNRTCINLKQKVMKKIYENNNKADINGYKLNKRLFYVDKITKENMEHTLFEILVKNYKNRKYRIQNLDSYKNKILMTNKNEYNVVIIITLFPNSIEDLNNYKNLSEYQLVNAFSSQSPVDIDIIRTTSFQNSDNTPKFDNVKTCHLYSIYNFLSECIKNDTVKMFKFIKIEKSLKIYINTIAYENFDIYMNKCCSNEFVCESVMFKNIFKSAQSKLVSFTEKYNKKLDENYQIIINNIKMLIYQYAKKISYTKNINSLEKRSLDDIIKYQSNNCEVYKSINYSTTSYGDVEESNIKVRNYSTDKNNLTTEPFVFTESTSIPSIQTNYLQTESNYYKRIPSESVRNISIDTIMLQDLTTGLPNTIRQQSTVSYQTRQNISNQMFFAFHRKITTNKHASSSSSSSSTEVNLVLSPILDLKEKYIRSPTQSSTITISSNNSISTKLNENQLKYQNQSPSIKILNNKMGNKTITLENNKSVTKPAKMAEFMKEATENDNIFSKVNSQSDDKIGVQIVFIKNNKKLSTNKLNTFKTTISQEFSKIVNSKFNESFVNTGKIYQASSTSKPKLRMYSKPQASIFENKNNTREFNSVTLATTIIKRLGNVKKLYSQELSFFSISPNKSILYSANITVPKSISKFITKTDTNSKFNSKAFKKIYQKVKKETSKKISNIDPNTNSINYRKNNNENYFDLDFIKYSTMDNVNNHHTNVVKNHKMDTTKDLTVNNVNVNPITNTVRQTTIDIGRDFARNITKDPTTDILSYIKMENIKDSAINNINCPTIDNKNDTIKGYIKSNAKDFSTDGIKALTTNIVKDCPIHVSIADSKYYTVNVLNDSLRNTTTEARLDIAKNLTTDTAKYSIINISHDVVETTNNAKLLKAYYIKDTTDTACNSTMDIAKNLLTDTSKHCTTNTVKHPAMDTLTIHGGKSSTINNVKYRKTYPTTDTIIHIIRYPTIETVKIHNTNTKKDRETNASKYPTGNTKTKFITTIVTDPTVKTAKYQTEDIVRDNIANTASDRTICIKKKSRINNVKSHASFNVKMFIKDIVKNISSKNTTDNESNKSTMYTANDLIMPSIKDRTIDSSTVYSELIKDYTRYKAIDLIKYITKNRTTGTIKDSITHTTICPSIVIKNPTISIIVKNRTKNNASYIKLNKSKDYTKGDRNYSTVENAKDLLMKNTKDAIADGVNNHKMNNVKKRVSDSVKDSTTLIAKYQTNNVKGSIIKIIKKITGYIKNDSTYNPTKNVSTDAAEKLITNVAKYLISGKINNRTTYSTIDLSIDSSKDFNMSNLKYYTTDSVNYSTIDIVKDPAIKNVNNPVPTIKCNSINTANYSTILKGLSIDTSAKPITDTKKGLRIDVGSRKKHSKDIANYSTIDRTQSSITKITKKIMTRVKDRSTTNLNYFITKKVKYVTTDSGIYFTTHNRMHNRNEIDSPNNPVAKIINNPKTNNINGTTADKDNNNIKNVLDIKYNTTTDNDILKSSLNYPTANILSKAENENINTAMHYTIPFSLASDPIISNEKYTTNAIITDSAIDAGTGPTTDNKKYVRKNTIAPYINDPTINNEKNRKTDIGEDRTLITKKTNRIDTLETTAKNLKVDVGKGLSTDTAINSTTKKANDYTSHNVNYITKIDVKVPTTNNIIFSTMVTSKHPRTDSIEHRTRNIVKFTTENNNNKSSANNTNKYLITPYIKYATIYYINDLTKDNAERLKTDQVKDHTTIRYDTAKGSAVSPASNFLIYILKNATTDIVHCTTETGEYPIKHIKKALTTKTIKDFTANISSTLSTDATQDFTTNIALALRTESVKEPEKEPALDITKAATSDISSVVTIDTIRKHTIDIPKDALENLKTHKITVLISDIFRTSTMHTKTDAVKYFITDVAPSLTTETVLLKDTVIYPIIFTSDTLISRPIKKSTTSNKITNVICTTGHSIRKNVKEYSDPVNKVITNSKKKSLLNTKIDPTKDINKNPKTENVEDCTIDTTNNMTDLYFMRDNVTDSTISLFNNKDSNIFFSNKLSKTSPSIKKYLKIGENNHLAPIINMTVNTEAKQNSLEKLLASSIIPKKSKIETKNSRIMLPMLIKEVKEFTAKASTKVVNNKSNIVKSTNFQNFTTQLFTGGLSTSLSENANNYKAMINASNNNKNVQVSSAKHVIDANSSVTSNDNFNKIKICFNTTVKYRRSQPGTTTTFSSKYPPKPALWIPSTVQSTTKSVTNSYPLYVSTITEPLIARIKPTTLSSMKLSVRIPEDFNKRTANKAYTRLMDNLLPKENVKYIKPKILEAKPTVKNRSITDDDSKQVKTRRDLKITTPMSLISNITEHLDPNHLLLPVVTVLPLKSSTNDFNNYLQSSTDSLLSQSVRSIRFEFNTLPIFTRNDNMVTPDHVRKKMSDTYYIINTEAYIANINIRKNILSTNKLKTFNTLTERTQNNLEKKKEFTEKKYKKSKTVRYNTFKPAEEDYEVTKKISISNYHNLNVKEIILNNYSPTLKHVESVTVKRKFYTFKPSLLPKVITINKLTDPPVSHTARHKINYHRNINKENLLDPFGNTNLYPINKLPSHTQRKVMKRIRLSKQNREVLAMDTKDFFSNRLSSANRLSRPVLFNHMPVHSVTVVPKEYVLHPMFEEESFRPKPLFVMNDNDFYRKDFGLHHHNDAHTLRHKINYIKDTIQVPPEKETTVERPIYLSTEPRILRDRIEYIRNVLHDSDSYRSRSNVVVKPVIEMQNRVPLYYFRRSGLYNNGDTSTEANRLKPTRRRARTIFFLSPTVPYNRYF